MWHAFPCAQPSVRRDEPEARPATTWSRGRHAQSRSWPVTPPYLSHELEVVIIRRLDYGPPWRKDKTPMIGFKVGEEEGGKEAGGRRRVQEMCTFMGGWDYRPIALL
jgi:hypothetical protein